MIEPKKVNNTWFTLYYLEVICMKGLILHIIIKLISNFFEQYTLPSVNQLWLNLSLIRNSVFHQKNCQFETFSQYQTGLLDRFDPNLSNLASLLYIYAKINKNQPLLCLKVYLTTQCICIWTKFAPSTQKGKNSSPFIQ